MSVIRDKKLLLRLLKDINDVRSALRRVTVNLPLYDINNENTPDQITADQDDYVIGNYDVLRLSSDAERTITGLKGGVKGRALQIFNIGSYAITLVDKSASSDAENRFEFATGVNNVILDGSSIKLYYDSTQSRWIEGTQLEASGIFKEVTPAQITANQNNYDASDYDVLRLSSDAAGRTITGFNGGVKGRSLRLFNTGNYEIIIAHQSASSDAENRIISTTEFDIVIGVSGEALIYYDKNINRWLSSYSSNADRISAEVRLTANQSVANATYTDISWGDIIKDTGGFFNILTPTYFTIPETGWYYTQGIIVWDVNGTNLRELFFYSTVGVIAWDSRLAVSAAQTIITISDISYRTIGDTISLRCWQNSGGALNVEKVRITLATRFEIEKL